MTHRQTILILLALGAPALAETPITALPYTISSPGSYYLTGNLSGSGGITISANDVTLDLRGHQLRGSFGSHGIYFTPNGTSARTGSTIVNGEIRGWYTAGIDAGHCESCRFERLTLVSNGYGLRTARSCVIRDVVVNGSTSTTMPGIITNSSCVIEQCTAHENAGGGIQSSISSVVRGCTTWYNTGYGFKVSGGIISDCSALDAVGFEIGSVTIRNCRTEGGGIRVFGVGAVVEGNSIYFGNAVGVTVEGTANTVIRNIFYKGGAASGTEIQAVPGNIIGPFVDGSSVGTSSNPHANYH